MKPKQSKSMAQQAEPDTYPARLVGIVDIGLQPGYEWGGKTIKPSYKLRLTYELVNTEMDDGRPFWVHEEVTNSDNERSTLAARVASLRADIKDISSMLGKQCLVTLEKNKNDYTVISKNNGVSSAPSFMEVAPLRNDAFVFDMDKPNMDIFESLPEFVQEKIKTSLEYEGSAVQKELESQDY